MFKKKWQQHILWGIAFFLPLLGGGCNEGTPPQTFLQAVSYIHIVPKSVTLTTELPGRTAAYMVSEVRPQVGGIIQQRLFIEGSDVQQGDVLYQIDPATYQAAYDSARAELMRAEANEMAARLLAERYRKVVKVNAVSKQDYDNAVAAHRQAMAAVAAARASLDSASINLAYTRVTAPISGRIGRSSVTPGALATQNQANPLATVQQLDLIYVDVTQSSTELLRLKRAYKSGRLKSSGEGALRVSLKLEDGTLYTQRVLQKNPATGKALIDEHGKEIFSQEPVIGTLKFSEVTVEQSTGVVTIRAEFPNPEGTLLPGMYVRAILEEGVYDEAILVPQKAVTRNNRGLPIAYVLTKNATIQDQEGVYNIIPRALTLDRSLGNEWLVREGLQAGELLMLEGMMKIRAGRPVKGELASKTGPVAGEGGTDGKQPASSDGKAANAQ